MCMPPVTSPTVQILNYMYRFASGGLENCEIKKKYKKRPVYFQTTNYLYVLNLIILYIL